MAEAAGPRKYQIVCRRQRVSFVKVFKAEAYRGGKRGAGGDSGTKAYSLTVMIPKDTDDGKNLHDEIRDTIDDAMDEAFPRGQPRLKPDKFCLKDGDLEDRDEYQGHWIVSCRNPNRPKLIDADGKTPLVEDDGRPYSGCVCNVWIRIWVQDNDYGQRVNASLEAVQFVRDGEAFSGAAPIPDEEFKDEREEEDRGSRRSRSRDDDTSRSRSRDREETTSDDRSERRRR